MIDSTPAAFGIVIYITFIVFSLGIIFGLLAFWIWMLIDCLKHEKDIGNEKVIWILVILFLQWVGALLYYFIRRRERL